jgi:hypothetical protein
MIFLTSILRILPSTLNFFDFFTGESMKNLRVVLVSVILVAAAAFSLSADGNPLIKVSQGASDVKEVASVAAKIVTVLYALIGGGYAGWEAINNRPWQKPTINALVGVACAIAAVAGL